MSYESPTTQATSLPAFREVLACCKCAKGYLARLFHPARGHLDFYTLWFAHANQIASSSSKCITIRSGNHCELMPLQSLLGVLLPSMTRRLKLNINRCFFSGQPQDSLLVEQHSFKQTEALVKAINRLTHHLFLIHCRQHILGVVNNFNTSTSAHSRSLEWHTHARCYFPSRSCSPTL